MTVWKSSSFGKLVILFVTQGALFLLLIPLFSQRVSSHSCEALGADSLPRNKELQNNTEMISIPIPILSLNQKNI